MADTTKLAKQTANSQTMQRNIFQPCESSVTWYYTNHVTCQAITVPGNGQKFTFASIMFRRVIMWRYTCLLLLLLQDTAQGSYQQAGDVSAESHP